VLAGESVEYEAFVEYKGRGGRWIHTFYTPILDASGFAEGWVAVVNDVSSQKATEQALKDTARQKDEFLAMLAHELRNPLAPIRNAAELLRLQGENRNVVAQAGGVIVRQVDHLTHLVGDLLDLARITRGRIALQRRHIDVAELVRTAASDHRPAFTDAELTLVVDVPDTPLWTNGDPTRLSQVIDNLLGNARKFTDRGGTVSLSVAADGEQRHIILRVRDTGIGIEPEMLPLVFEAFSQSDRSLDRTRGGLGLGLAIVKGLVELHEGRIEAASAGLGHGCAFTVTLPLLSPQANETPALAAGPESTPRLRVLIVEDNRDAAETLKALLEAFGHQAELASTGAMGVEAARRNPPDVVVCDIGLPGMDGFEVARTLRSDPDTANTRLIAITGYGKEADLERALAAGFDGHLVKPADPIKLRSLLIRVADGPAEPHINSRAVQ